MPVLDDSLVPAAFRNRLAIEKHLQHFAIRWRAGAYDFKLASDLLLIGNAVYFPLMLDMCG